MRVRWPAWTAPVTVVVPAGARATKDLAVPARLSQRGEHIVDVVLAYLKAAD